MKQLSLPIQCFSENHQVKLPKSSINQKQKYKYFKDILNVLPLCSQVNEANYIPKC